MAIMRTGPIVGAISGRIGSIVFKGGSYGAVVQSAPNIVQKGSVFAQYASPYVGYATAMWNYQDEATRMAWDTVARQQFRSDRLGVRKPWTGRELFMRQILFTRVLGPLAAYPPPADPRPRPVDMLFAGWYGNIDQCVVTGVPSDPGVTWDWRAMGFRSFKYSSFGRPSWAWITGGSATGTGGAFITTAWDFRLGMPDNGEGYGIRVVTREQGSLWGLSWDFREYRLPA
jgi:hypothetical protein